MRFHFSKRSILIKWKLHDLLRCFFPLVFHVSQYNIFIVFAIQSTVPYSYFAHCYQLTKKEIVYSLICDNAICNRLFIIIVITNNDYETEDFLCSYVCLVLHGSSPHCATQMCIHINVVYDFYSKCGLKTAISVRHLTNSMHRRWYKKLRITTTHKVFLFFW